MTTELENERTEQPQESHEVVDLIRAAYNDDDDRVWRTTRNRGTARYTVTRLA